MDLLEYYIRKSAGIVSTLPEDQRENPVLSFTIIDDWSWSKLLQQVTAVSGTVEEKKLSVVVEGMTINLKKPEEA